MKTLLWVSVSIVFAGGAYGEDLRPGETPYWRLDPSVKECEMNISPALTQGWGDPRVVVHVD